MTPTIWNDKVEKYLLNPDHPKGGPKCRLFLRFGFKQTNPDALAFALFDHLHDGAQETVSDPFGSRIVCRGPLRTPCGETPFAISVWGIDGVGQQLSLITAYITDPPENVVYLPVPKSE